jgi:hypothetical protein
MLKRGETQRAATVGPEQVADLRSRNLNEMFPDDVIYVWSNLPILQHLYENPLYRQRIIDMGWLGGNDPTNAPEELKKMCTSLDYAIGVLSRAVIAPNAKLQVCHGISQSVSQSIITEQACSGRLTCASPILNPKPQKELDDFKREHFKGPSLCLHFRFARLGEDTDFTNDGIPYDIEPEWFWNCAERYRYVIGLTDWVD